MTTRYRCSACGNLTRFDVVATRQTRAFHHYTIGGELSVEEEEELSASVERVTCRWCGGSGDAIEEVPVADAAAGDAGDAGEPVDAVDDGPGGG